MQERRFLTLHEYAIKIKTFGKTSFFGFQCVMDVVVEVVKSEEIKFFQKFYYWSHIEIESKRDALTNFRSI